MALRLIERLVDALIARAKRTPYEHLPGYMERYWLVKPNSWFPFAVRIHHILRSDDDRHMHDHPWRWCSMILRGHYYELTPASHEDLSLRRRELVLHVDGERVAIRRYNSGAIRIRQATARHKLVLDSGSSVWSLFIMGRQVQTWGFYTPEGKVPWFEYLNANEVAAQRAAHLRFGISE
jgi:hypothetical protein